MIQPFFSLRCCILVGLCCFFAAGRLHTQDAATTLIRDLRQIHTPNGIEVSKEVILNDVPQWITVRGKDKNNPILLFVHGGPASPVMPISWAFQNAWEDFFTVVQWDQRYAGKNWLSADTAVAAQNLSPDLIIRDGLDLMDTLRAILNQDKVFVLGYSFGSKIGIEMAAAAPQKIHAFIGMGQVTDLQPEQYLYERLVELATADDNQTALQELKSIAPYPNPEGATPVGKLLRARKWARFYNGGWYGKPDFNLLFSLPELSPDYTPAAIEVLHVSTAWVSRKIMRNTQNKPMPLQFEVPILFFMGKHDLHTPYEPARSYFDKINAPYKKFVTFEFSAHVPMLEEPGKFLLALVTEVLPLAK
jgi:proline iminopeptidase